VPSKKSNYKTDKLVNRSGKNGISQAQFIPGRVKTVFLTVLSGVLLAAAFPRWDIEALAWIALVPLLWISTNLPPVRAFGWGWLSGVVFFFITIRWITNTLVNYGNIPPVISFFILLLLVVYCALYWGIFAAIISYLHRSGQFPITASAPFIWVALEHLRTFALTGFPWALLGYSQYKWLTVIQISDLTGVYGVSFLIVLVNAALTDRLRFSFKNPLLIAGACLAMALGYGTYRLETPSSSGPGIRIKVVQGNIEQEMKWKPEKQARVVEKYRRLSLSQDKSDMVVWPEAAIPFYFQADEKFAPLVRDVARRTESFLLFGSLAFQFQQQRYLLYNSAFLLDPQGQTRQEYRKIHLVPFGEYIPLRRILKFLGPIIEVVGDFGVGEEYTVFSTPKGKFSVAICFEIIFGDLVRRFFKNGAEFMVNITNDAWFGKSAASYQHMSMVTFRAVENRVWIVRAANTGISGFVEPAGRIAQATEIFEDATSTSTIHPSRKKTFYTEFGDLFSLICYIICIFTLTKGSRLWSTKN
jgi:apolipoprotein N-acyltransferase